ncbi:MAG TPA: hypothetical protein VFT75_18370 [Nocardioidaceae bacterium]|nr:hypothetical protein [Nocardioidaceae bacterium]
MTASKFHDHVDRLGVRIRIDDIVTVVAWGVARLVDCGIRSRVVRSHRVNIVIIDADGRERAVSPSEVLVARRDGCPGHEANRPAAPALVLP